MPDPESAFKPQSSVADTAAAAAVKSVGKPVGSVRGSLAAELSRRWTHLLDASRVPEGGLTPAEADSHRAGTSAREAKVTNVAFHNFCSMVGAGVLALPSVVAALGWGAGAVALFLSWFISWITFVFLVRLHEIETPAGVVRMDRYPQLTKLAFGDRVGTWALTPFQIILFTGIPIAYAITAAESLRNVVHLLVPGSPWGGAAGGGLCRWLVLFSILQAAVVQVRSFHSLSWVSLIGAAASVFYIVVAFVGSLVKGRQPGIEYSQPTAWATPADRLFGVFNALATSAFAYGGHNIACEIQATLPMPPSTVNRMMLSVNFTFFLTALSYFSVAFTGFWAFGNRVAPNILTSLSRPTGVIAAANLAVFFHVLAGYHVYLFPLIDMADGWAIRRGILPSSLLWRLAQRTAFVFAICLVACAIPFFGAVLGFLGAVSITPTTFMMPCALWLKLKAPGPRDWRRYVCWATLAAMSVVMVLGAAGAIRDLVAEVQHGNIRPFAW